jgi:hypothetical protein
MLKCVDMREGQLERLKALSESIVRNGSRVGSSAQLMGEMTTLLASLRYSTFSCCEAIIEWRRGLCQPQAFLWKGMNYILKMKDDMEVVSAAAERLTPGGAGGGDQAGANDDLLDDFTHSRREFAARVMEREETLQQALFEENDRLLASLQWMPTLNLEPGLTKPKPIRLDAQGLTDDRRVEAGTAEAATPPGGSLGGSSGGGGVDWELFERGARGCFEYINRGSLEGIVPKKSLRKTLTTSQAGGGVAATRQGVAKLWRRLDALYGQLVFRDVSVRRSFLSLSLLLLLSRQRQRSAHVERAGSRVGKRQAASRSRPCSHMPPYPSDV